MESGRISVAAFTPGRDSPSARFRIRQYMRALHAEGVDISERPSRAGTYPPASRFARPWWAVRNLSGRAVDLWRAHASDVTFLQREFLSTLLTLEPLTRKPRILDVDDAIWVYGGEGFARRLAGLCEFVICGNDFLADHFARIHRDVRVLPTVVDTERFVPIGAPPESPSPHSRRVIGWSGSRSTLSFLARIEAPLRTVLRAHPDAVLRVVSESPPRLATLPRSQVEFVPWSLATEVASIQTMTVGLMPLDNSVVARGKCALKMLLYMACGVPAVVSPVGSNRTVLAAGEGAIAASSDAEWVDVLEAMLANPVRANELGRKARSLTVEHFSVQAHAPRLASLLRMAAGSIR